MVFNALFTAKTAVLRMKMVTFALAQQRPTSQGQNAHSAKGGI